MTNRPGQDDIAIDHAGVLKFLAAVQRVGAGEARYIEGASIPNGNRLAIANRTCGSQGQGAGIDDGRTGVGVDATENESARTVLDHIAGTADGTEIGSLRRDGRAVEYECGVVGDGATGGDRSRRAAIADL